MNSLFAKTLLVSASLAVLFEAQGLSLGVTTKSSASHMVPVAIPLDLNSTFQDTNATLSKGNATVTGNKVVVTHSNIIIVEDQDKPGLARYIKNMMMNGTSPQDDDALTTQIIGLLFDVDNTTTSSSDLVTKMMPTIKTVLQSRGKPEILHQVIVKRTELSPNEAATVGDHDN